MTIVISEHLTDLINAASFLLFAGFLFMALVAGVFLLISTLDS